MLDALNFVKGAVAKKDYVPELTHFQIKDGRVTGFNGQMTLSSPIDLDIEANPKALPFVKAVNACKTQITLHITPSGRLAIRSGKFRKYIDCLPDDNELITFHTPESDIADPSIDVTEIEVGEQFLNALKMSQPFQGQDASRPWAHGVMFRGMSAFTTNNICMVEYWHGQDFPVPINIPKNAVAELLRIKQTPERVQVTKNSITFHFEGERWLRTLLLADDWPDITPIFSAPAEPVDIPETLFETLEQIKPFLEDGGKVYFEDGAISTSPEPEAGTIIDTDGIKGGPCFHHSQVSLLQDIAEKIDFSTYPKPCRFTGENLRGVIMGMLR